MMKWSKKNLRTIIVTLLIVIVFCGVSIQTLQQENPVIDEVAHIVSGYVGLRYGNFNVNLEHPPLVKIISAIPLLATDINYRPSTEKLPDQWDQGQKFLYNSGENIDTILFLSRTAVVIFNALLLLVIAGLGIVLFQNFFLTTGLVFFLSFEPTLLGHAHYITTDSPLAYAAVAAIMSVLVFIKKSSHVSPETNRNIPQYFWILTTILLLSLPLMIKFSGVVIYGASIIILSIFLGWKKRSTIALLTVGPLLLVYSLYLAVNWNTSPAQLRQLIKTVPSHQIVRDILVDSSSNVLTKPLVSFYVGFRNAFERSKLDIGGFPQFLDGQFLSNGSWRTYFPKAFLYKESPAILIIFLLSIALFFRQIYRKQASQNSTRVFGVLCLLWIVSISSSLNIGIRHIAPILALQILFSAIVLEQYIHDHRFQKGIPPVIYSSLVALQILSITTTYPYFLSYFNTFSGGFERGYTHLIDSNLDWGENKKRLAAWVYENNIPAISVDYWGNTEFSPYDPEQRMQKWSVPQNGMPTTRYLAVTPMWIVHSKWKKSLGQSERDYSFLETKKPIMMLGGGLWIYDLAPDTL